MTRSPDRSTVTQPNEDPQDDTPADEHRGIAPGSIIVGHDGSSGADQALTLALGLARDLATPITVIRSWSISNAPHPANYVTGSRRASLDPATAVDVALVRDTASIVAKFPTVVTTYLEDRDVPQRSLPRLAQGARMLVVGSRGLGTVGGAVLGSVSAACVHRATFPVLVVPTAG